MAHRARLRTLWSSGAALCLALGTVIALAGAANADDRPTATTTSTVSGSTATINVAVNRGTNAIKSATCALDGTPIACGKPTSTGKKSASYQVSSTAGGTHTFTIKVTLTDGGTATGSTTFTLTSSIPIPVTTSPLASGARILAVIGYSKAQIASYSCTLDGQPIPCDDYTPDGATESHFLVHVTGLQTSHHTFTVTATTDAADGGNTYVGSTTFDTQYVDVPTACSNAGGTYTPLDMLSGQCTRTFDTADDATAGEAAFTSALDPACRVTGGYLASDDLPLVEQDGATLTGLCYGPEAMEMAYACYDAGSPSPGLEEDDANRVGFRCYWNTSDNTSIAPINDTYYSIVSTLCARLGGTPSFTLGQIDGPAFYPSYYECLPPNYGT